MRKYFIGTQRFTAKVETLTQELDQFPALGENCNIDINDDFTDWPLSNVAQNSNYHTSDKTKSKIEKKSVEYGQFTGNYKNDGISGEFDSLTYSHSQEMLKVRKVYLVIFIFITLLKNKYNVIS